MAKINVLPKNISELIAAGEVVERPSAVIKELIENSVDAGATEITVEIRRGGITYMSVRDNGSGIAREDVPTAFLRHATSKIKTAADLDSIGTLGFRGEALAAISAVSKTEIITRTKDSEIGTHFEATGGLQSIPEDIGCDVGTIIIVKDLFYNTPARMKFLKKDVSEGNSVAAVVDRLALSHPEIAFKFIREGKVALTTSGDGNLKNVIYSVLGRDFAMSLIPVNAQSDGVFVSGFTCKPIYCKQNRNGQFFFLNGRLVLSKTAGAAVEQAYKNSAMVGRFPCCVLCINVPHDSVDVNVHPAKTEVRFSDERKIFGAIYYAVKNALSSGDTRPEIKAKPFDPFAPPRKSEFAQSYMPLAENPAMNYAYSAPKAETKPMVLESPSFSFEETNETKTDSPAETQPVGKPFKSVLIEAEEDIRAKAEPEPPQPIIEEPIIEPSRFIGSAFNTYIIAQKGDAVYFIDKHAAHERLLFEKLKDEELAIQNLLTPVSVSLTKEEYSAVTSNLDMISEKGFDIEDFGNGMVVVRAVPAILKKADIPLLVTEIADELSKKSVLNIDAVGEILHTVACKAAIKGGSITSDLELKALAERILNSNDIMYCPHGRPVAFKITKRELEKQFGRIQ